jgi:hypothetical protein
MARSTLAALLAAAAVLTLAAARVVIGLAPIRSTVTIDS